MGVIASDLSSRLSGRLITADGDSPRFATTALGFEGLSTAINGLADGGLSQGMEAALTAVTPPLTLDPVGAPPLVCTEDSGCPPSVACVPSVLEPGLSHCMGWNGQFLRHDAALHVVFVSSVTDSSGKAVSYYASALRSVVSDPSRFQAHAIVGDLPQGCVGPGIIAAGSARYTALANTTGGLVMSVCAPDWAPLLTELGERVFGWTLQTAFPLTRRPVESTITVMVAGTACTQGWSYDAAQNAVVFDPGGPCMPQFEEAVVIDYDAVCGALP